MSKSKPAITIHFGASHDDITVDGNTFVRHKLSRKEQGFMRRVIVGGLEKIGYFLKSEAR